jgi:hypothetical protein
MGFYLLCTAQTLRTKILAEIKCFCNTGNRFTRPEVSSPASGGIGYFPDEAVNEGGKPWSNDSPTVGTKQGSSQYKLKSIPPSHSIS